LIDVDWTAYESTQRAPARNLAWEDALLEGRGRGPAVFFVYRNDPCVVIGRNQNPWREARTRAGLPVFRRRSGGGTVYQDEGNLNWSFMTGRDAWIVDDALNFVASALGRLGVEPERDPRGALFLGGGKICGTARRYFGPSVLIHGTLLVSSDLGALRDSLTGLRSAEDRAVASVPSPVRNLADAMPGLTVASVRSALFAELRDRYGPIRPADPEESLSRESWADRENEHGSWEWVYGSTLAFSLPLGRDGAGPFLRIREGRIEEVRDAEGGEGSGVDPGTPLGRFLETWKGRPLDPELLAAARGCMNGR